MSQHHTVVVSKLTEIKIRYLIVKKYTEEGTKVDMYKYRKKDGMMVINPYDAELYDSVYAAERELKFITSESGIFQIEKIYLK